MSHTITPTIFYRTLNLEGLTIFYREAGRRDAPAVLLLHGFPSSSHMFRNLIPMLADTYHVVAPDFPGYGHSSAPSVNDFDYSYERLATVTEKFTETLNLSSYALYLSDIGASVGFRLAVMHPERVTAMIVQNGDAHVEAINKEFSKGLFDYWGARTEKNAHVLLDWLLTIEGTKWHYLHGVRDPSKISPDNWVIDQAYQDRPGNKDIQLSILYNARRNLDVYADWQEYFRKHQPPMLITWGKNDGIFTVEGAELFKRDIPNAEIHLLDTGHFALEEEVDRIGSLMHEFLDRTCTTREKSLRAVLAMSHEDRELTTRVHGGTMKATQRLHNLGQSLWLDNITRDLLSNGTLKRYIDEFSLTGLTSNPTIFDHAIKNSTAYDVAIIEKLRKGQSGEALFFELALEDVTRAADLFRPAHDRTSGVDGWVSLEVSPLLVHDTADTLAAAKDLSVRAARPNVFIKIPGTREGLPAIEESIFAGVPINVTLLFSREQYLAAADAFLRGIERRIDAGLNPNVASVASLFVSRWDVAVANKVPESLRNTLGIAIAHEVYAAYRSLLTSERWGRIYNFGARPQRLLWASTGTKDPTASDILYVKALAAPFTVNTMPEKTLKAFADHGEFGAGLAADTGSVERALTQFARSGINVDALAAQLQDEGAKAFAKSWDDLLKVIEGKCAELKKAA